MMIWLEEKPTVGDIIQAIDENMFCFDIRVTKVIQESPTFWYIDWEIIDSEPK